MKLLSFHHANVPSYGLALDHGVIDLGARWGATHPTLSSILADESKLQEARILARQGAGGEIDPDFKEGDFGYLPVIPKPDKIFCVGLNYHAHLAETNRTESEKPVIFFRFAGSQIGHLAPMVRPQVSEKLDYEGELAVIIGKPGRHIPESQAYDHVAGYACYNDGSIRDWQMHTHQWGPGKTFQSTGGFGPWLVTPDEIGDPESLELQTILNGQVMQQTLIRQMIFKIPELIAYLSTIIELSPGDVIVSGTPGGVGVKRNPPVFMKPGDVVEIKIRGLGTLRNPIVDEA